MRANAFAAFGALSSYEFGAQRDSFIEQERSWSWQLMMIVALLRELRLCGLYVKAKETDKKIIQAVKQVINLFTYKAVRTVMNQLYEMNPTEYRWFYDFVTRNKPSDGKHFLRVLVKEKQDLAERVMVTRLHLYAKWIKKCDHAEMYKEISDQNLELMRERLMATVIWPSEMFFNLLLFGQHNLYFDSSNKSHQFSGTNLLLSSFPVMFIAALGCVYLHFQTKKSYSKGGSKSSHLAFWKRPVLAMAPFGIVSLLELTFAAMFVALLIWSLANYLYVSFGHLHMHKVGEKVWEAKFRSVSLRLGYIGNICWAFLFFPVTRGSSLLPLVGLTSESSIKYHIWLGHISTVLFFAHSVGFFIYWGMTNQMVEALEWSRDYLSNVAGEIAFVISLIMWATSYPRVRRKMFEVFFYSHYLYIIYLFFYIIHVGVAYFCMILPGIFLFLIDRYLRFLQSRTRARLVSARLLPCGTMELNFSKNTELNYTPTSLLFINVPSISKLQWHPFTVSSNSNMEPDKLSIVIKSWGTWSQRLYQELSSPIDHLEVSVEGPYGPTSSDFLRHENLVMISGGSGITPFISVIREIIFQSTQPNCKIPNIHLICAFKHTAELTMLDLLLPLSGTPSDMSRINLQIQAYITRETEQPQANTQKLVQTIWFKPKPSDASIAAVLGPNSWLWLCAIISSSFVMFLLLLGIITRHYMYPWELKEGVVYNYTLKTIWDMFFVCVSVFIATSVLFLWQKSKNSKEGKQIQNVEVPTPTSSPGAWLCGQETELESLPHQSLVQSTKVHLGARPDLMRILFDCKGSDVGVLVCGPRKMRHEVAKICSSGLAKNLHFESISFNW